jgi:hypothetical protein
MSNPDPQKYNWLDGILLCTKTFGVIFLDLKKIN